MDLDVRVAPESGSTALLPALFREMITHSVCSDDALDDAELAPGEKKRKDAAPPRTRLQQKRFRTGARAYRAILEHVTPEVGSSPGGGLRTYGPFSPGQFEDASVRIVRMREEELVDALAAILGEICAQNEGVGRTVLQRALGKPPYRSDRYPDSSSSVFFSLSKPGIVLKHYLARFVRYLNVSRSVFVVGLIYLDRVCADDRLLALTELNIHRLLTTALCTAAKFVEDESHRNSSLSKIGGVPTTEEMNVLELQFLRRLNWDCSISVGAYRLYEDCIVRRSSLALSEEAHSGEFEVEQQMV